MTAPKPVHEAWLDVMTAVGSIGKNDRNTDQNFAFRGIDATVNAVGPALRDARVFVRPKRIVDRSEERYESKRGANMRNVTLTVEWEVTGPGGDSFVGESVGEAADSGDKAVSKAHSVAYRTFLLQSLSIPTGDRDPDSESHERASRSQRPSSGRDWVAELAAQTSAEGVRTLWAACVGCGEMNPSLAAQMTAKGASFDAPKPVEDDPWTTPASTNPDSTAYDPELSPAEAVGA